MRVNVGWVAEWRAVVQLVLSTFCTHTPGLFTGRHYTLYTRALIQIYPHSPHFKDNRGGSVQCLIFFMAPCHSDVVPS
jgi:hypothetical protein